MAIVTSSPKGEWIALGVAATALAAALLVVSDSSDRKPKADSDQEKQAVARIPDRSLCTSSSSRRRSREDTRTISMLLPKSLKIALG